jgi:glycogen operon protein
MAARLSASGELFNHQGRRPWACVNFITAHDGFTLNDWASYNEKHNDANNENNNDGSSDNRSWNCGAEGLTDDPMTNALRERQIRNMLATLLLSQGTPMLLAGDEFGRSQNGNNNAYCQDNEISWVDWDIQEKGNSLIRFVQRLIGLRRDYPILRRSRFLTGCFDEDLGIRDLAWINANGTPMSNEDWDDANMKCFGMLIDGRAQATGIRKRGGDATVLIVLNAHFDLVNVTLPACQGGESWRLKLDSNVPETTDEKEFSCGTPYAVTARSILLFDLAVTGK